MLLIKWIVFVIEWNLLLPCFGLSAMYQLTTDPGSQPGISPPPYRTHILIWTIDIVGSILNKDEFVPPPLFLARYVVYCTVPLIRVE